MRSTILAAVFFLSLSFFSCSGDEKPADAPAVETVADTISPTGSVREVETDSGKLIITTHAGAELEDAVLLGPDGKILGRGQLYDNKPSGAWLKYDANGNVVSAVHHSGATTYALDPQDFKTVRVEMKEMGISFIKPVGWDTVSPYNPLTFVSYEKDIMDPLLVMKPNINISKGMLEAGQTVESLAADMLNMRHQNAGRVELVDEAYLTIDSCKSFRRYGMYYTEDSKIGFLDAIIVHGNTIYVISCAAQNKEQGEFLKYQAVFENLVLSVEAD